MAELGWAGLTVAEDYGGAGLDWVDLAVLLEETGRGLLPSPLISHSLAATAISEFGNDEQKRRLLPSIASGETIGAVALLEESEVLAPGGVALAGTQTAMASSSPAPSPSYLTSASPPSSSSPSAPRTESASLSFRPAPRTHSEALHDHGSDQADGRPRVPGRFGSRHRCPLRRRQRSVRLLDLGAVAVTAESVGAMSRAHEITTQYAKDRIQFGAPIGKYQGVKHPRRDAR